MLTTNATGLTADELLPLYASVGWTAYTGDPPALAAAVAGSTHVVVARDGDRLVGLARVVSDGVSICYLQDVLVHQDFSVRAWGVRWSRPPSSRSFTYGRRCC